MLGNLSLLLIAASAKDHCLPETNCWPISPWQSLGCRSQTSLAVVTVSGSDLNTNMFIIVNVL